MVDVVDQATRSRIMARVRGRDTKPELALRHALHRRGIRYGLHNRRLPGKPDLVFRRFKAVCFVNGCFWHRHVGCRYAVTPETRSRFWVEKFDANVRRDRRNLAELAASGWRVAIVWECALREATATVVAAQIEDWLATALPTFETDTPDVAARDRAHEQGIGLGPEPGLTTG
jgi:DNA mismatch endonuclease (patch repair protein)